MDAIDHAIIAALRENARMSFRDLGERVSLSANATADRVRRLEDSGVIAGYTVIVNPSAAGRGLIAFIDMRLRGDATAERFEEIATSIDAVTDIVHVTGRYDYELRLVCRDGDELDAAIVKLKREAGVLESSTRIALRIALRRPLQLRDA